MHYCALLVSSEIPNEEYIANIMEKYSWNKAIKEDKDGNIVGEMPVFTYDYYAIGGRYCGYIKLKIDVNDEDYNWNYLAKEPRNNRLFISSLLIKLKESIQPSWMYSEEKYFPYMGSRDDVLYVDGARAKDIVNIDDLKSYICIPPDGNAIARESWRGSGLGFASDEHYDEKFKQIIKDNMNGFFTILDIHD